VRPIHGDLSVTRRELVDLAHGCNLSYPIQTKLDFMDQMNKRRGPVLFRGSVFNVGFASSLIPEFFFPIASEDDLLGKTLELLAARGLIPIDSVALNTE